MLLSFIENEKFPIDYKISGGNLFYKVGLDIRAELNEKLKIIASGQLRMGPKKSPIYIESVVDYKPDGSFEVEDHQLEALGFSVDESYIRTEVGTLIFIKNSKQSLSPLENQNIFDPLSLLLCLKDPIDQATGQILLGGKIRSFEVRAPDDSWSDFFLDGKKKFQLCPTPKGMDFRLLFGGLKISLQRQ